MNYWTQSTENIYVAAHRGWCSKYPENTLEAMQAALDLGVDQLETDVRITKDGELVLMHDGTVDRTTNGTGAVNQMTLEELRQLDAGSYKGTEYAGFKIPTFIEFMELVKDHPTITLDIELKEYPILGNEEVAFSVCDRVLKIIDDYGFTDRCVINTFNARLHEYIYEKYGSKYKQHVYFPVSSMGKTADVKIWPYTYGYCCCMFDPHRDPAHLGMAPKSDFDIMRARGVQPWAGASVKDEASVDLAIKNGAELITCNNPDVILALLRAKGKHK